MDEQMRVLARLVDTADIIRRAIKVTGVNKYGGLVTCAIPDQRVVELEEVLDAIDLTDGTAWTSEVPASGGYYWYHSMQDDSHEKQRAIIVFVVSGQIEWPVALSGEEITGRFYGPIISPPIDYVAHDDEPDTGEFELPNTKARDGNVWRGGRG